MERARLCEASAEQGIKRIFMIYADLFSANKRFYEYPPIKIYIFLTNSTTTKRLLKPEISMISYFFAGDSDKDILLLKKCLLLSREGLIQAAPSNPPGAEASKGTRLSAVL
ncbi:MAG: hypothetical protein ACJ77K_03780 [Bacteroidia bacterium]